MLTGTSMLFNPTMICEWVKIVVGAKPEFPATYSGRTIDTPVERRFSLQHAAQPSLPSGRGMVSKVTDSFISVSSVESVLSVADLLNKRAGCCYGFSSLAYAFYVRWNVLIQCILELSAHMILSQYAWAILSPLEHIKGTRFLLIGLEAFIHSISQGLPTLEKESLFTSCKNKHGCSHTPARRSRIPSGQEGLQGRYQVAVAALAAVSGVCSIGEFLNCLVAAIASVTVVIISGFSRGRTGETGAGLLDRSVDLLSTVQHHFPNGTVVQGFQPAWLEVRRDHKVTVGNHFETIATRLESGHVRISARVNQGQGLGQGLSRFLNIWTRTDDNPGDTGFIDVLFNDLDIGGTGLQNDGGTTELSNQVGEAVASTIINDQAETVCAALINPNTNGEIIATEWFIRAGDGSSGSTPSGACDNA
ncbi:hypothetical protein M432DRAFT_586891 [Thermoascus aurantiacus ATCC 26904]